MFKPSGSPSAFHVIGVAPVALRAIEILFPASNLPKSSGILITGASGEALTVIVKLRETLPAAFVALTRNVYVPAFVSVPERSPAESTVSPAGISPSV